MPDTSQITNGLIATLAADATLLALMPNGVYYDLAPQGATRYVIVSLFEAIDVAEFGRRAIESALYLVKAVALSSALPAMDDIRAAAARIDDLLEDVPFEADGYEWITTYRTEPKRITEPDGENRSTRWFHRGGMYRVQFAVIPASVRLARHTHTGTRTHRELTQG
jgi:hypothetical protein